MVKRATHLLVMFVTVLGCATLWGCGGDKILPNDQQPDPVVVDVPIAFIKRSLPLNEDGELISQDLRRPNDFVGGAAVYIKARASASAPARNISDQAFFSPEQIAAATAENPLAAYDVKDLEVSYDGKSLLFAMRAPEIEDADDDEQPTWDLWRYDLVSDSLHRPQKAKIPHPFIWLMGVLCLVQLVSKPIRLFCWMKTNRNIRPWMSAERKPRRYYM